MGRRLGERGSRTLDPSRLNAPPWAWARKRDGLSRTRPSSLPLYRSATYTGLPGLTPSSFSQDSVKKGIYSSAQGVAYDLFLVWSNAREYNERGSQVYNDAEKLEVSPVASLFLSRR